MVNPNPNPNQCWPDSVMPYGFTTWLNSLRLSDDMYMSVNYTIIDSDNGLLPARHQAINWTNAGILLIEPLETNLS